MSTFCDSNSDNQNIVAKALLIALLSSVLCACSSFDLIPSDSLVQRLKGRGPVLVSPDNPYLAANLLLQQESKDSKELSGFLETKGLPSALSVSQDFFSPASLKFFYRENSEQYNLELLQGVWVIKGPGVIDDASAQDLLESSIPTRVAAIKPTALKVKVAAESTPRPSQKIEVQPKSSQDLVPLFDENDLNNNDVQIAKSSQKTDKNSRIVIPAEPEPEVSKPSEVVEQKKPSPIDELISQFASSPAEATPRGDLVHYVTSEKETLKIVAKWYTKTSLTLSRIARANKLDPAATLSPGDQVVIPAELVKNKMSLPEEAIGSL